MTRGEPWPEWRLAPCGTPAAYRRHRRHNEPACDICLEAERIRSSTREGFQPGALVPDRRETRNGMPEFRPYVYRGLGYDQYEEEAASWTP